MKETMMKRIHGIGKAGAIISRICRVFLIIGFVGVLIGLIAVAVLPKNLVTVDLGSSAQVKVDLSGFAQLSEEDQQSAKEGLDRAIENRDDDYTIQSYEVDESSITLDVETGKKTFRLNQLIGPLVVALLYLAASYVTLWFVGKLCTAFRNCVSPFDGDVIQKMKNFAYSLIPWAVLSWISDDILSEMIPSMTKDSGGLNLTTVLLILLILGLCAIFRYGAELQREHDETL